MLGAKNCSQIDEFLTRGRHEDLNVYYISQSYFTLPIQSIRNISDRLILFKRTRRDVKSVYHDNGAFDMVNDEFKEMCRDAWSEKFNYKTTNFEPIDNEDVIIKAYLDEKLKKIDGHFSYIEKDFNELKLQ